ncbi:MAG: 23S rRNA (pseudouridine(1915)-N(3))-methyltransferase RlmH [Pseudomonadota bacterium]
MRIGLLAVGRLRDAPEAGLTADYLARASAAGRSLGLGPVDLTEIDERRARSPDAQAERLIEVAPGGVLVALDERGKAMTSPALAGFLARQRDGGTRVLAFAIGGADGHGPALLARADRTLSLGPMVWPHALARVMMAEQIYRAVSILAGAPYHRV